MARNEDDVDTIKEDLSEISDRIRRLERHHRDDSSRFQDKMKRKMQEKRQQAEEGVSKQPLRSVGIAAAAGVLAGMAARHLMRKKK